MSASELDEKMIVDERREIIKAELASSPADREKHERKAKSIRKVRSALNRLCKIERR